MGVRISRIFLICTDPLLGIETSSLDEPGRCFVNCMRLLSEAKDSHRAPRPAPRAPLPCSFDEDLHQVKQRLRRLLQSATRVEFEAAVKVLAARENVGARKAAKRQLRPVRSATHWTREGLDAGPPRRFERVLRELGMMLQYL